MANGTREYSKHHKASITRRENRSASWRPGGRRQASTAGAERPQPNAARRPRNPYKVAITRMSCPERTNVGGPPLGRVCECENMLWNKYATKTKTNATRRAWVGCVVVAVPQRTNTIVLSRKGAIESHETCRKNSHVEPQRCLLARPMPADRGV